MIVKCPHCEAYNEAGYNTDSAICIKCGQSFNVMTAEKVPTQRPPAKATEQPSELTSGAQSAIAICQFLAIICLVGAIAAPFLLNKELSIIYIASGIGSAVFWFIVAVIVRAVCSKK